MNLNEIKNLSNQILSESTQGNENYLNRWPYTSPYLTEAKAGSKCGCCDNTIKEDGTCGCGPECKHCGGKHEITEGNIQEVAPVVAGALGRMAAGAVARKGAAMAGKSMLKKRAANMAANAVQNKVTNTLSSDKDELNTFEEVNPNLKAIDAKNKKRFLEQGAKAKAERQADHDAYRAHKNEVMAKGGRPVDALDSWMRKKLGLEHIETVSKLIESNKFSEEEIVSIIETIG